MTISASSSNFTMRTDTASVTSADLTMPSAVPAHATLLCWIGISEAQTISSVTDTVNGSWSQFTGPDNVGAAADLRAYFYYFLDAAAGTPVVTATASGSTPILFGIGWFADSSGNACTFDAFGTARIATGNETSVTSNDFTASGAGALFCALFSNNTQNSPEPSVSSPDVVCSPVGTGRRHMVYEPYSTGGTYSVGPITIDSATTILQLAGFREPAGLDPIRLRWRQ